MPVLSFSEYRPDVSDYQGVTTRNIKNVVPRGDGYGPFPALVAATSALPDRCRGLFYARKNDGSIQVFAATDTSIYSLNNTDLTWTDVSGNTRNARLLLSDGSSFLKLSDGSTFFDLATGTSPGTYSSLSSNAHWQFAQFNNFVVAVQQNVVPQVYDLTSSTNFDDLGGSPPQAAYVAVVNRFLVLSGLASPNVYRVHWSGLNNITQWTSGVGQSDFQDLPDGGIVRSVGGGEFGVIIQDSAIRRMTYSPGAPYVFSIDRVSQDDGLFAPYSAISAQDRFFFCSQQGFKMLVPGGYPQPIGKERVDRTFFADVDTTDLKMVIAATDPKATRVIWVYKSVNGQENLFDAALLYDWSLDRWAKIEITGEFIASLGRSGITLENIDTAYGTDIDTIDLSSFDDISNSVLSRLSAADQDHAMGFFTGGNLEAILETPEQGNDGKRIYVNGVRPVTDAPSVYGSVSYRETAQATASYSTETLINAVGKCPARVSTRYARSKVRIPAGTEWTYASGIEPDVSVMGTR